MNGLPKRNTIAVLLAAACLFVCVGCAKQPAAPAPTADAVCFTPVTTAPTASPAPTAAVTPTPEPTREPELEELIAQYVAGMSFEDKLGQLVMFGFGGKLEPDAEFIAIAEEFRVGSVILNGSNIDKNDGSGGFDSAKKLLEELEKADCGIKRLCAADVEGGAVTRFSWEPALPSAYKMSAMGADEIRALFESVGNKLRSVGINADLAPVMDIAPKPLKTALGSRIFSSDPDTVSECGIAVIDGLHAGGCLAAAKHFPGHGGTDDDSHSLTPVVSKSYEELWEYDLAPFRAAVDAGVDFVMIAHILYPALDQTDIASMSPLIIDGLLRGELGFDGVVISDDFLMQGLKSQYGLGDAAVKFINAGGDMILCGADYARQREIMRLPS